MSKLILKSDFIDLFKSLGIGNGSLICLQANLSKWNSVIGGYQCLLDALFEVIGKEGCVMIPSFSYSTLDPACMNLYYDYEDWKTIREECYGYDSIKTCSDVYSRSIEHALKENKVMRSNHPVYSFYFIGNYNSDWLKQSMNYPISFSHILKGFVQKKAFNLMIGEKLENSILIPAIAKTLNKGSTYIEKAYVQSNKKKVIKTYLNTMCDEQTKKELLDYCYCKTEKLNGQNVYCVSIEDIE